MDTIRNVYWLQIKSKCTFYRLLFLTTTNFKDENYWIQTVNKAFKTYSFQLYNVIKVSLCTFTEKFQDHILQKRESVTIIDMITKHAID